MRERTDMELALQLTVGFSVGMALLLSVTFASGYRQLDLPWQSRLAGFIMLAGLALIQLAHLKFASGSADVLPTRYYVVVLFLQSLGFYWLLLGVLRPDAAWRNVELGLPILVLALALTLPLTWAIPVALTLGTAAALHLCVLVYRLRAMRRWFALELKVLVLFAGMGVAVAAGGALAPGMLGWFGFAFSYALLIALGFFVVGWLLLSVPDLVPKTRDAVAAAYAQTTLARIDRDAVAARLRLLFEEQQIHRDDSLSLASVAGMLELSPHQLSELVNTEFGLGFSRFVRRYRVETAKKMLVEEPRASVLSVGMAAGFNSQSSFYVAFKEQVGVVPGEYRRQRLAADRFAE